MSQAEKEELAVRKRREEGTPVTDTTFAEWWEEFSTQMAQQKQSEREASLSADNAKDKKNVTNTVAAASAMEERLTGFQVFSEKAGVFNLEKLEAAAEEMENELGGDVDEALFNDDEDLDDLDFDSDEDYEEDSDDDDDDDEPDI